MDFAEAIDRLVQLGREKQARIVEDPRHAGKHLAINGGGDVTTLPDNMDRTAGAVTLSSLSSFADFVRENRDGLDHGKLTIVVESHRTVSLASTLDEWRRRTTYLVAQAPKPDLGGANYACGQWLPLEDFLIWLATGFDTSGHQQALLGVLSSVVSDETNTIRDDGMAQQIEVKKGLATRGRETVPSPATLTPFCTFAEIDQPDRLFLVRLKGQGANLTVKLIPSGSGMWEADTRANIAADLKARLEGINVPIIY